MKRINNVIQNYLLYACPFVIGLMLWAGLITSEKEIRTTGSTLTKITWEILSWNLMIWFLILIIFLVMIIFVSSTKEQVIQRIANIQERDEREALITGQATRTTFLSTLSILIFLLFLSIFSFNVKKLPSEEIIDGRAKTMSINLNFKLLDEPKLEKNNSGDVILEAKELPVSKTSILLFLIAWQIFSFRYSAKKLQEEK